LVERPKPGVCFGTAGCPCGEVLDVSFVGDTQSPTPLSTTPRRPPGWKEEPGAASWHATLRPGRDHVVALVGGFAYFGLLAGVKGVVIGGVVGLLLTILRGVGKRKQRCSFAFEGGCFRAETGGQRYELPLEAIVRFDAKRSADRDRRFFTPYYLSARLGDHEPPLDVPLTVDNDAEAQFVADRANALLASGGRSDAFGYRGEQLRVAEEPPRTRVSLDAAESEELEDDSPAKAAAPLRRS
jgi:hypothetical protein